MFDESCEEFKYYEYRLAEEEKALAQTREPQTSQSGQLLNDNLLLFCMV